MRGWLHRIALFQPHQQGLLENGAEPVRADMAGSPAHECIRQIDRKGTLCDRWHDRVLKAGENERDTA